eukprot:CAMPEP_0113431844 /NCGR_PEP_ID=MMETSP0013_2-20120614/33806_1 /TAXON_ID=2843 ORGANISM="Skeletonema costatum, Strain 1716" /NCGR_SAMPLE_ID=MMETSP0013_2 /ASSEMBLY_ACC=CAM_ASM_000158 /LENGTH=170 /DNA_ID=CAMNT_0000320873 /DNA_START=299 /DNA_END=809 /DNA_ORIENTATION=+ /assembly_acc=CAM_ASM_000158
MMMGCCSKMICNGCDYANKMREFAENLRHKCPFCRDPIPNSEAKAEAKFIQRVEANDPVAIREMGVRQYNDGDHESAFEYFTKAAGLSDVDPVGKPHPLFARHDWGSMFGEGLPTLTSLMNEEGIDGSTKLTTLLGIGEKDEKKEMYHLEKAAICGHIEARYNLAICEKM